MWHLTGYRLICFFFQFKERNSQKYNAHHAYLFRALQSKLGINTFENKLFHMLVLKEFMNYRLHDKITPPGIIYSLFIVPNMCFVTCETRNTWKIVPLKIKSVGYGTYVFDISNMFCRRTKVDALHASWTSVHFSFARYGAPLFSCCHSKGWPICSLE